MLKPLFPEAHNLIDDWCVFNHYLLLTSYGYVLASTPGSWQWIAERRHKFAFAGVGVEHGVIHRDTPVDAVVANVFTWLCVLMRAVPSTSCTRRRFGLTRFVFGMKPRGRNAQPSFDLDAGRMHSRGDPTRN